MKLAQNKTIDYLKGFLVLQKEEQDFWKAFNEENYRPELLFESPEYLERIIGHPMALWKCGSRKNGR